MVLIPWVEQREGCKNELGFILSLIYISVVEIIILHCVFPI